MSEQSSTIPPLPRVFEIYLQLANYPILSDRIRQRMFDEIVSRGVLPRDVFEREVEEKAGLSAQREGRDPRMESNEVWERRKRRIRNQLTDFYFAYNLPHRLLTDIIQECMISDDAQPNNVATILDFVVEDSVLRDDMFLELWTRLSPIGQRIVLFLALSESEMSYSDIGLGIGLAADETTEQIKELINLAIVETSGIVTNPGVSLHSIVKRFVITLVNRDVAAEQASFLTIPEDAGQVLRSLLLLEGMTGDSGDRFVEAVRELLSGIARRTNSLLLPTQYRRGRLSCFHIDATSVFSRVEGLATLPIIFVQDKGLSVTDLEAAKTWVEHDLGIRRRLCLIMFFGKDQQIERALDLVKKTRVPVYGFDFVFLTVQDIRRLALALDPAEILRNLILSQIDLRSVSPFIVTGPAPRSMFFGRDDILKEIIEHADSTSYAIIGGRRIGKTSTLLHLHLSKLPQVGFRSIYHDCSTTPTAEEFLNYQVRTPWMEANPGNAVTFDSILRTPEYHGPIVLLLDEADKLVTTDRYHDFWLFNNLRFATTSGHVQIILSGERVLRQALRDSRSPLFNFANELVLGPLDRTAVEELVTRPMKQLGVALGNTDQVLDAIWNSTCGHPSVVQRLCRRLIESMNDQGTRRITLDDVLTVVRDPIFQRDDFLSTYWETATTLERIISLLMADNQNVNSLSTVREALLQRCGLNPTARQVDDALQRLVDLRSILRRTPKGYAFAIEAFPEVLAETITLDDMLEILVEEFEEQGE